MHNPTPNTVHRAYWTYQGETRRVIVDRWGHIFYPGCGGWFSSEERGTLRFIDRAPTLFREWNEAWWKDDLTHPVNGWICMRLRPVKYSERRDAHTTTCTTNHFTAGA